MLHSHAEDRRSGMFVGWASWRWRRVVAAVQIFVLLWRVGSGHT
jgi:hypothetical protein